MNTNEWVEKLQSLGTDFPIGNTGAYPSIAKALDDGVSAKLNAAALEPIGINPRYVEELIRDCTARIANCLTIREKAQDVEVRAIGDAISYKLQTEALESEKTIRTLLKPIRHLKFDGATAATISKDPVGTQDLKASFSGDQAVWNSVNQSEVDFEEIRQEILETLKMKAGVPGNGSNFAERFDFLKSLALPP
jgi:hypothetical protein